MGCQLATPSSVFTAGARDPRVAKACCASWLGMYKESKESKDSRTMCSLTMVGCFLREILVALGSHTVHCVRITLCSCMRSKDSKDLARKGARQGRAVNEPEILGISVR